MFPIAVHTCSLSSNTILVLIKSNFVKDSNLKNHADLEHRIFIYNTRYTETSVKLKKVKKNNNQQQSNYCDLTMEMLLHVHVHVVV